MPHAPIAALERILAGSRVYLPGWLLQDLGVSEGDTVAFVRGEDGRWTVNGPVTWPKPDETPTVKLPTVAATLDDSVFVLRDAHGQVIAGDDVEQWPEGVEVIHVSTGNGCCR